MKTLVIGGTGTVGSQVVRELVARKQPVRVLTRDPAKAKDLPAGVETVRGDLTDPSALKSASGGVDGLFLLNQVTMTEAHEGLTAVCAAREAGVKRVVYLSVHNIDRAPWIPHLGSKVAVEAALKGSGIPWTILRPNNFYQDDYWYKDAMLQHGVYPQPFGNVGLSRVDVRDIAEAAAIALTRPGHDGQTYNLVGPRALTGKDTAEVWSQKLGRPVAYGGDDLDAWEKQALRMFPAALAYDFKVMYAFFQQKGLLGTLADVERVTTLLGHAPRGFEAFAEETASAWKVGVAG